MKLKRIFFVAALAACGANAMAELTADSEGVYQIATAADLMEYAALVNGGTGDANAVLTADIDMTGQTWTPIGQDQKDFKGHFDGQGHRILNLTTNAANNNQALFGQAVGPAIIENVIIDASCNIQGAAWTAGILGHVWGDGVIVRNCGNEAKINGSAQNSAGIVACSEKVLHISNCYNTGVIVGDRENAGICAWMGSAESTISNCFSTATGINGEALWRKGEVTGQNMYQIEGKQGTAFTQEMLSSGELCYKLNGNNPDGPWRQAIGTDAMPKPFGTAKVYANGTLRCDGTSAGDDVVYSNTNESVIPPHTFVDGLCAVCGTYDPADIVDGVYMIGNAKQLVYFSAYVNDGHPATSATLKNDIDMAAITDYKPIGTDANRYRGTFDGQGYRIKNLIINNNVKEQGLFSVCSNATIKNLIIDKSCSIRSTENSNAAFVGVINGGGVLTFRNCGNEASVVGSVNNAAFVGMNWSSGNLQIVIENCYNTGTIGDEENGHEDAVLVAWNQNAKLTAHNVLNIGEVKHIDGNGRTLGRGDGAWDYQNCYNTQTDTEFSGKNNNYPTEKVANGEVCYLLNGGSSEGAWTQNLGTDAYPVPFTTRSKVGKMSAAGLSTYYGAEAVTFGEGIEVYTGKVDGDVLKLTAQSSTIPAETAVILAGAEGYYNFAPATDAAAITDENELKGSAEAVTSDGALYALALDANDKPAFMKVASGTEIPAGKAYLESSAAGVKSFQIIYGEGTGIDTVETAEAEKAVIYDIAGRRVEKATKGIYIINGKKVLK